MDMSLLVRLVRGGFETGLLVLRTALEGVETLLWGAPSRWRDGYGSVGWHGRQEVASCWLYHGTYFILRSLRLSGLNMLLSHVILPLCMEAQVF